MRVRPQDLEAVLWALTLESRQDQDLILSQLLTNHVTLGKSHNLSVSQFPHLEGDKIYERLARCLMWWCFFTRSLGVVFSFLAHTSSPSTSFLRSPLSCEVPSDPGCSPSFLCHFT